MAPGVAASSVTYALHSEYLSSRASNSAKSIPGLRFPFLEATSYASSTSFLEPVPQTTDNSLSVNGTNSYVEVPNSTSLNITGAVTVEAWFKVNNIPNSYQSIVSRFGDGPNNDGGYLVYLTSAGKPMFATLRNGGDWDTITGATTVSTGVWHHVAGVFDGSQMRVYLDGSLDGSKSSTSAPASGTQFLRIGAAGTTASGTYFYFNGLIDEVRVSNGAVYSTTFTPSYHLNVTSSTRGLWKFDGESASDASTNGNNGGLHNGAAYSLDVPEPFWTNVSSNLSVTNGTGLTKTGTTNDWDAGAVSAKTISSGDCYVEFTAAELSHRMCGLSNGDSNQSYGDIDFAIYPAGVDQQIYIYESGTQKAGPLGSYGPSDRLRVSVEGGVVKYRKNGVLLMTSSVAPTYPLLVDTSLYSPNATLSNAVFVQSNQAPTVSVTSPANNAVLPAGSNVTITANATDGDGSVTLIEFFRDAVKLGEIYPPSSSFTWNNAPAGNYTLTAKATDNLGATTTSASISVTLNQSPAANAGGPYTGGTGTPVQFSGNGSSDSDGTITSYDWNFGDGATGTGATPTHAYTAGGSYTVRLAVTDNNGATNSATATVTITGFANARLDPLNRTGGADEDPLSRNFSWNLSLVGLPGRSGLDLNIGLSYNSLIWTKTGNYISFNDDHDSPAPGFRLGFPVIQPAFFNSETNKTTYLLITPGGGRTELRQVGTSPLFEAADSSHLLLDTNSLILSTTDGTQLSYSWMGSDYQCTQIKDRNGNFITIHYDSGRIDYVRDTLARTLNFNYNGNNELSSITQTWTVDGQPTQHTWASFAYINQTIQTNFPNLTNLGPQNGSTIRVLSQVTLDDGSHYNFEYTSWGQVWKISSYAAGDHLRNYRSYNLPLNNGSALTDCPRFTERHDWAENWNRGGPNGASGLPSGSEQEVTTTYALPTDTAWTLPDGTNQSGKMAQVTMPDGTYQKIYYAGTAGTNSGWSRGLVSLVQTYDSANNLQRQAVTTWTQDNTSVSYQLNPRVTETNIHDPAGNRARTRVTYQHVEVGDGTTCELPQNVYEYQANASTVLRYTHTDYNLATAYTSRRIIGLVSDKTLYEIDPSTLAETLMSKVSLQYDETGSIQGTDAPVQHDNTNYSYTFVTGRANLSSAKRYNVDNIAQFTTNTLKYNTAGAAVLSIDALGHQNAIAYGDNFSDGNNSRNTLAYPTTVTDADNFTSSLNYNFDFGAATWKQTPLPNVTTNQAGPQQTFEYDSFRRLTRVTNSANSAYTRFVYGANYIETWSTVNTAADEAHSLQIFDGLERTIATLSNHPGSSGGYSGQLTLLNSMGRVVKRSNPTETSVTISGLLQPYNWSAAGDDATTGWLYTQQTYDWKGRPLVTTNTDATTKEASYAGCGCAGGEVTTLIDEGTIDAGVAKRRQQKIYADVLGRVVKTEALNWQGGSVYSTTVNTYNARDQIKLLRQYQGLEGSGTYQDTTVSYDGYGRVKTKHAPEQQFDPNNSASTDHTAWDYNADDTVQKITDARGVMTNFGYNNRRLVTSVVHDSSNVPAGAHVSATPSVGYVYDAAGNRTSMTDGLGSTSYAYDQLSRLTSETRNITSVGAFAIGYGYNLAGELTSVTDPFGQSVSYAHDSVGRTTSVNGSGFGSVTQFACNIQYRASGGTKAMSYGNGKTLAVNYNARLAPANYTVPGQISKAYEYYDDGRLKYAQDLIDGHFDRLHRYDQMGRLTEARTGTEARGGNVMDGPYREGFSYDVFGQTTVRTTQQWSEGSYDDTASYTNGRRDFWHYDADGRVTNDFDWQKTYDAAGRVVRSEPTPQSGTSTSITTSGYDGDGNRLKTGYQLTAIYQPVLNYHLYSTVLGGQVIAEIEPNGQKTLGYVYDGDGALLALGDANGMEWQHVDPAGMSVRRTFNGGNYGPSGAELDAVAADMRLSDPGPPEEAPPPPDENSPSQQEFGNPTRPATGCSYNHVQIDCSSMMMLGNVRSSFELLDASVNATKFEQRWVRNPWKMPINIPNPFDPFENVDDIFRSDHTDSGHWITTSITETPMLMSWVGSVSQRFVLTGFKLGPSANFNRAETKILRQVYFRIHESYCRDFIEGILAEKHVSKELNDLDKLIAAAELNKWHSGLTAEGLGISASRFVDIERNFANSATGVTLADQHRVYLGDNAFLREGNDSSFKFWSSHTDIDTAGHLVHELFHVAGIDHSAKLDAQIHEHCGLPNTNF